jgi:predicted nucleotidyltransferase
MMPADLKELLRALNAHGVKFIVVGGYALGAYTEPRATKDLDIFIRSDEINSEALYRALAEFGAPLQHFTPADFRDGSCFQIGSPPGRVDILQQIDGITFDEAWKNRVEANIEGEIRVAVISREDLIRNKLASGREQDLLDVKKLRASDPPQ